MGTPLLLLAGCLMSRLEIDEQAPGSGGGGSTSDDGGSDSGGTDPSGAGHHNQSGGGNTAAVGGTPGEAGSGGDGEIGGAPNGESGAGGDGAGGSAGMSGAQTGGSGGTGGGGAGGNGTSGSAGMGGTSGGGSGGTTTGGGSGGTTGGGSGGTTGGGSGGTASGGGGTAGNGGAGGTGPDPNDPLTVKKSTGCSKNTTLTPGTVVTQTIETTGTKGADATGNPGPWQYTRTYTVRVPSGYDKDRAYPLIFQMPGCGGSATGVYNLDSALGSSAIRIGIAPPPNSIDHAVTPNQLCFDDREPKYSVDYELYENLMDKIKGELCVDEHRVYVSGESSGSFMANELACLYADVNSPYALRGVLANTGGLPTSSYMPPCGNNPLAGMWIHEVNDSVNPFALTKVAVDRALQVNECTASSYDTAAFEDYPIGGGNVDSTCKKIVGCPAAYPLVVCALPGAGHGSHANVAVPGFSTFVTMLSSAPLIKP